MVIFSPIVERVENSRHYVLLIFIALTALVMAGCSTTPISENDAGAAQEKHVYDYGREIRDQRPNTARVIFLRDKGFFGSFCTHVISINGTKAFALDAGESFVAYLDPGEYFFSMELGGGGCPNTVLSENAFLETDEVQLYRISAHSSYQFSFTRVR